jgi:hypothetical protein
MTEKQFDLLVQERVQKIQQTLVEKGKEYRRNNDPLHNFNIAARLGNTTREKALWGFALKHYVSFMDILNDVEKGNFPKEEVINEKLGDLINYLVLCEASLKDRL